MKLQRVKKRSDFLLPLTDVNLVSVLHDFEDAVKANGDYALDTETTGLSWFKDRILMISMFTEGFPSVVVPLAWEESKIKLTGLAAKFESLVNLKDINLYFWNTKFDKHFMRQVNVNFNNKCIDANILGKMLDNEAPGKLKLRAKKDLKMEITEFKKLFKLNKKKTLLDYPVQKVGAYAADDAIATYRLARLFMGSVIDPTDKSFLIGEDLELGTLYRKVEHKFTDILYKMERRGVILNYESMANYLKELLPKIAEAEKAVYREAGKELNIASPKQVLAVLRAKGLDISSTAEKVLSNVAKTNPLPILKRILDYRAYEKIRGTYIDGFKEKANKGVIHTSFNQGGTNTGRLSSSGPNMQNIPREGAIRNFFKPPEGYVYIVRDYGQLELRVVAHIANDKVMIEEFLANLDIHKVCAAPLFNKRWQDITKEERRIGKSTTSFGVLFGMAPWSLAQMLNVSEEKALGFIVKWFKKYKGVDTFFKRLIMSTEQAGYVRTFLGRVRRFADIKHPKSRGALGAMHRELKNFAVQGGAADLVKLAMIHCEESRPLRMTGARMLLQVHDELMFQVPEENALRADRLIADLMVNFPVAKKLRVPLITDGGIGYNWHEAKEGLRNDEFIKRYG